MKIVITGATGFLGFALLKQLVNQGNEVTVIVRPDSKRKNKITEWLSEEKDKNTSVRVVEWDLSELSKMDERADILYHFAWNGSSGADREDYDIQYTNIGYTAEAVRAAKKWGCRRIVCAGSQAEYGVIRERAYEETTVPHPFMMYGAAKNAAYQMGRVLAKQLDIEFVWPRIYSVYGVGENQGTLVNYVIETLEKGETPQLSACENMWNFLYIDDCVRMLIDLGQRKERTEGVFHIASEDTRILRDYVDEIRDIVAPGAELAYGAKAANPERTFWLDPDVSKILSVSDPCQISFGEGIRKKTGK